MSSATCKNAELSIVIPTYGRDDVLCETLEMLFSQHQRALEIIVVDQSPSHTANTAGRLSRWQAIGAISWIQLETPSITGAMNRGVLDARGDIILFLDDDIVPQPDLVAAHRINYTQDHEVWAVVGQVIQPGQSEEDLTFDGPRNGLNAYLDFPFNTVKPCLVANVMAGNLSVRKHRFLETGGFDENFTPPVAFRFETEFARRIIRKGGKIRFCPEASIRHLQCRHGGTRSKGSHYTSLSPVYGCGDYYFALLEGHGLETATYWLRRCWRHCRSKYHIKHPWWIPIKFIGEIRAMLMALRLYRQGPRLLNIDHLAPL